MSHNSHKMMPDSKNARRWIRETKMSDAECARLLYEEIESLMRDCDVFYGQYHLLANHYKTLSVGAMAA
ncbi:MAG: hypothetical protein KC444_07095 [Nitrosopumilus sp.]|nr:hypothetical protein [Nitrosopumilus sp.]